MHRHIDAETPLSPDPQLLALNQVLNTLLPIRRRRLRRCEREQHEQECQLTRTRDAAGQSRQLLEEKKLGYLQLREAFVPQYSGVIQPLNDLRETLDVEKSKRSDVIQQLQHTHRLNEEVEQQQERLSAAQLAVQRCRREIEKMEYLLKQNQGDPA